MVLNDLVDSFCYSLKNAGLKGLSLWLDIVQCSGHSDIKSCPPTPSRLFPVLSEREVVMDVQTRGDISRTDRLSLWFVIHGTALNWFKSYLSYRLLCVKCSRDFSERHTSCCGVSQRSVRRSTGRLFYARRPWTEKLPFPQFVLVCGTTS